MTTIATFGYLEALPIDIIKFEYFVEQKLFDQFELVDREVVDHRLGDNIQFVLVVVDDDNAVGHGCEWFVCEQRKTFKTGKTMVEVVNCLESIELANLRIDTLVCRT
jgi:hypothetical protein